MRLTPKQTKAFRIATSGSYQFVLFGGAIRGGKSWWLLLTFIYLCSKFPKSRWVIIRKTLPVLKQNTFPTFQQIVDKGLAPHIQHWNHETHTVTFRNESQLIFMAESFDTDKDFDRFKGLEINGAGVDEINETQERLLYKLFERAGSWMHAIGQPPIVVLATCNPSQNWVKERVYDPYTEGTLPETWAYIPSKITDNPHIPQSYLQSLRDNLPTFEYQRFVDGDWEVTEKAENPFLLEYDPNKHEADVVYDPKIPILISFDFNLQPFCATIWQYHIDRTNTHHFYCVDELSVADGSIPKMIDVISNRYGAALSSCYITGDAMGNRGDMSQRDNANYYEQIRRGLDLRISQIHVPKANPTHANSRAQCNYVLRNFPDFKIGKDCPITRRDFRSVECDATGSILKKNRKVITQQADMLDTGRYAIDTYLGKWYEHHLKKHGLTKRM
jgi:hypothetical protein